MPIQTFRHKGLQRFFETGSLSGIKPDHKQRLRLQLALLDAADAIGDMNRPGYRLHSLTGNLAGYWSISISGNWRLTFEFRLGNAYDVDYKDYH